MLTHTSGLKNYTGLSGFEATKKLNAQKFVAALGVQPLESKPGEAFKYCNSGYNLAGYIIEKVTGKYTTCQPHPGSRHDMKYPA